MATAVNPLVESRAVPLTRVSAVSRQALLCGLLAVAAVVACRPWVEMGYIDDWSNARTAKLFAETGHFIYNGWLHSPEGWQIVWTAPFIKVFGFSYAVVRMSLLPIVFATVYFFQRCLAGFGLTERNASFGALTLGLSPAFVPAASSYMTDIPSLFAVILCLFLCQKSVAAATSRSTFAWLTAAALANLVLGTVRQTGWLGVLVIVPCVGLWLRHRRGVAAFALALTAVCGAAVAGVLHWYLSQPYSVPESLLVGPVTGAMLAHLAGQLGWAFVYLMPCVLSILAMFLWPLLHIRSRTFWLTYLAVAALALIAYTIARGIGLDSPDGVIKMAGKHQAIHDVGVAMKQLNVHLSYPVVIVALFAVALVLLLVRRVALRGTSVDREIPPQPSWQGIVWLLVPYSLVYLALLIPRGSLSSIYQRYLVALAPLPIVCLLALYQQRNNRRIPALAAVIVLTALAYLGVGEADRIYSENRARLIAVDLLRGQGIPRTAIWNTFSYDYETETDVSGHVNEPEVRVPANALKPYAPPAGLPQCASDLADSYAPSVVPRYFLRTPPRECLAPTPYGTVGYTTLLPPFHRSIYIQQLPSE